MKSDMLGELLEKNKQLEDQFLKMNDSSLQLIEINKEHQRINGELREENKRLNNIIKEVRKLLVNKSLEDIGTGERYTHGKLNDYLEILDKENENGDSKQ